jgi:hypothetical protein
MTAHRIFKELERRQGDSIPLRYPAVNKQQGKGHPQPGEQSRKQLPSPEQRISEPGSCKLESQCFELRGPVRKQRGMQFQKTALQAHKKDAPSKRRMAHELFLVSKVFRPKLRQGAYWGATRNVQSLFTGKDLLSSQRSRYICSACFLPTNGSKIFWQNFASLATSPIF